MLEQYVLTLLASGAAAVLLKQGLVLMMLMLFSCLVSGEALSADLNSVNAQISDALLRGRSGCRIILHTLTRCPRALVIAIETNLIW